MLARYGVRWILPCVIVPLSLCLLGAGLATEEKIPPVEVSSAPPSNVDQSGNAVVNFNLLPEPKTDYLLLTAILLNLPVAYVGMILSVAVPSVGEVTGIGISTVLAFLLWYQIGRWIDRQREPGQSQLLGPGRIIPRVICRVLMGFILIFLLYLLPHAFRHHEWNRHFFLGWSLWCAFYFACSFWGGWREKKRLAAVSLQPTP